MPVVQAYGFTKYLGKLVLTFNGENRLINAVGGPIFLDQTISQGKGVIAAQMHDDRNVAYAFI